VDPSFTVACSWSLAEKNWLFCHCNADGTVKICDSCAWFKSPCFSVLPAHFILKYATDRNKSPKSVYFMLNTILNRFNGTNDSSADKQASPSNQSP
jgi:hypothetical protein